MKKKTKGGRPPGVVTQERKQKTVQMLQEGKTQAQIARALGVSEVAVCRSLKELRKTMTTATAADFDVYRKGQLSILEMIEENLLNGSVEPDVAREWRQVRADIAKLLGLNAPEKSLAVNVDATERRGLTFEFLRHSHGISEADMQRVFAFMDALPRCKPVIDASYLPEEDKQLTSGEDGDKQ